jgi:hypothetical protein
MIDAVSTLRAQVITLSAAQAPLLKRIEELEARLDHRFHQLADMTTRAQLAEVRLAELESAQPKVAPVENLVSDEAVAFWTHPSYANTAPVAHRMAVELQQRRQRDERGGE